MNKIKITLGGEDRDVRFGLGVLGDIQEHLNIDMSELGIMLSKNPFKIIPVAIYFGIKYEVEKTGSIPDFTLFDVLEWIEDLEGGYTNTVIDEASLCFMRSLVKNVPNMKQAIESSDLDDEQKKRLIG